MILSCFIVTNWKVGLVNGFRFFSLNNYYAQRHYNLKLLSSSLSSLSSSINNEEDQHVYTYTTLNPTINNNKNEYQTKRNLQSVLHTAEKAAYQAGQIMIQTSGKISISKTKVNTSDLVTESDLECQRVIKEIVKHDWPLDSFLGEEDVEPGSVASENALDQVLSLSNPSGSIKEDGDSSDNDGQIVYDEKLVWVVDPIDGTTNFQAGLPMFCVSIGVVLLKPNKEPQVIAGVIYNPILKEMISAVRGRGCYINGKSLPSNIIDESKRMDFDDDGLPLNKALINVGFPVYSEGTLQASSRAVTALATKVRGLRMIASASQVMSWVAQGKLNAYVSWDLNAWDIAAGMVIVEESGGFISDFNGNRASIMTRDMITSCNEGNSKHMLSKAILEVLKENDCLEY